MGLIWNGFGTPFWSPNRIQNRSKTCPKSDHFFSLSFEKFEKAFWSSWGVLCASPTPSWGPGRRESGYRLLVFSLPTFRSLELVMALVGASCRLLGRCCVQNGPQKLSKKVTKSGSERGPKVDPHIDHFGGNFGVHFGSPKARGSAPPKLPLSVLGPKMLPRCQRLPQDGSRWRKMAPNGHQDALRWRQDSSKIAQDRLR